MAFDSDIMEFNHERIINNMNQLIMIFLISLLVLVHEIGHFIAARLCNVRVTRFGIGMPIGPSWKLFKWKKTTFYIHAFLFGGYI